MAALLNFARARFELLKLNLACGMDPVSDKYKQLSQAAVSHVQRQISTAGKINCDTATQILKLMNDGATSLKMFSAEQVELIRDAVNSKLDQAMGASNASGSSSQKMSQPEVWLTQELQETMLASPPHLDGRTKITFRVNALAAFFGGGGMLHPAEHTSRDITSLALLDVSDATLLEEGLHWVRTFKGIVKQLAKGNSEVLGDVPLAMDLPAALKENYPKWYDNMYKDKEPGSTSFIALSTLLRIRSIVGARSTWRSSDYFSSASRSVVLPPRHGVQQGCMPPQPQLTDRLPLHQQLASEWVHRGPTPALALTDGSLGSPQPQSERAADSAPRGSPASQAEEATQAGATTLGQEAASKIGCHIQRMRDIVQGKAEAFDEESEEDEDAAKVKKRIVKRPAAAPSAATQKTVSAKAPLKKPAAAPNIAAKIKGCIPLAYPGEKKRPPLQFGKSVVYFSPGRYRVMLTKGDRVDKSFPYLAIGSREAWEQVCTCLRRVNPGVRA